MTALLLIVIYIAFISLGLPDSLFGCAWPVMQLDFNVPLSYAGAVTMTIAFGTVISSIFSDRLTKKFGTSVVTVFSVFLTVIALFGFSMSDAYYKLFIWAVPYGLGAGAIDAALNNYVAVHYASRYMNWLHCFWGAGAMISPYIMGHFLSQNGNWHKGYSSVGLIQAAILVILIASLPLWKKVRTTEEAESEKQRETLKIRDVIKIKGVKFVFLGMFAYCSLEATAFAWTSSFFVSGKGLSPDTAARYAALFYIGITVGRLLCGFVSDRLGDYKIIGIGLVLIAGGIITLLFADSNIFCLIGILVTGIGCAPVYPALIHITPTTFGEDKSQSIVGLQMASAYIGSTFMPPVFGLIANSISISLFPVFLGVFGVLTAVMIIMLSSSTKNKKA
ncbi:MAG: MFS transporter [Acutalibacteraceae bacterium]